MSLHRVGDKLDKANDSFSQLVVWGLGLLFLWWIASAWGKPLDDSFLTFQYQGRLYHTVSVE